MKKITNPIHNFHILVKARLHQIEENNIEKVSLKSSWGGGGPKNINHHTNLKKNSELPT